MTGVIVKIYASDGRELESFRVKGDTGVAIEALARLVRSSLSHWFSLGK